MKKKMRLIEHTESLAIWIDMNEVESLSYTKGSAYCEITMISGRVFSVTDYHEFNEDFINADEAE